MKDLFRGAAPSASLPDSEITDSVDMSGVPPEWHAPEAKLPSRTSPAPGLHSGVSMINLARNKGLESGVAEYPNTELV